MLGVPAVMVVEGVAAAEGRGGDERAPQWAHRFELDEGFGGQ